MYSTLGTTEIEILPIQAVAQSGRFFLFRNPIDGEAFSAVPPVYILALDLHQEHRT